METITAYRIEHEVTGKGPFFCGMWGRYHARLGAMPEPENDGIIGMAMTNFHYAFTSWETLLDYISVPAWREMREHGLLRLYATDDYRIGRSGKQVAFRRETATLLREFTNMREIFDTALAEC